MSNILNQCQLKATINGMIFKLWIFFPLCYKLFQLVVNWIPIRVPLQLLSVDQRFHYWSSDSCVHLVLCTCGSIFVQEKWMKTTFISNGWHDIYTARKFVYGFFLRILYNCIAIIWKVQLLLNWESFNSKLKLKWQNCWCIFLCARFGEAAILALRHFIRLAIQFPHNNKWFNITLTTYIWVY